MNEKNVDLIGEFLTQKLSKEQQVAFQQSLEIDDKLKADYEKLSTLKAIAERKQLLDGLKAVHEQKIGALATQAQPFVLFKRVASFAAAASVAFMFYVGNADFEYVNISEVERGGSTGVSALGNFETGVQLLQEDKAEAAIEQLNLVVENEEITSYYRDAAQWYKVVALAKLDKDEEAKTLLIQIEKNSDFKYKISWIEKLKVKIKTFF